MIGRAYCWIVRRLGGRHKWGKSYNISAFDDPQKKVKECRHCGEKSVVKTRKAAAKFV